MTAELTEGLPEADTPAEVLGTLHFVLNALGRELGDRYDAHLKATIGPNWLRALANIRNQRNINLHDPYFVLSEPLKFSNSPTRACLPSGGAFYNELEVALDERNAWSHHEVSPLNLATLKDSITRIHSFATAAEMKLGRLCSDVKKRINAIGNGTYPPAGTAPREIASVKIDSLLAELAAARVNEDALRADVSAAQALLDEAARAGAAQAERVSQISAIQARLDEALAEKQKLEFVIEALATAETAEPVEMTEPYGGEWVSATPGHQWPSDIPSRRVTMMSLQPDLFDEATRQRVAAEFGPEATSTIAGWKATVAANATIFLTATGQAVTFISGTPIYLGTLGDVSGRGASGDMVSGFFIPHTYTLRMNGTIEDRSSGETLDRVVLGAAATADRLLDLIPTGGRLRVTTTGGVAKYVDAGWTVIASVKRDEWFPGHL